MTEIKHDTETIVRWVRDAYWMGFEASSKKYNAETLDKNGFFEKDPLWLKLRDVNLKELLDEIGVNE